MAHVPAWAPNAARTVEFWSDVAASGETRGWWSGKLSGGCLEEGYRREDVVYSLGLPDQNGVVDEKVKPYLEGQLCN
ncbi:hypothetical protein M0R45_004781 [Rubus argutus]|uniref:Uncharacterized protein n=1 Tax=Rubus argutus TaxID=59490 RepID=A0AAW1YKS4_RUBAR